MSIIVSNNGFISFFSPSRSNVANPSLADAKTNGQSSCLSPASNSINSSNVSSTTSSGLDGEKKDMKPLFETIIEHIEAPEGDPEKPLQVLISTIDYNEYVGRIGIGKVDNGEIAVNKECIVVNAHDPERKEKVRITKLYEFEGLDKVDVILHVQILYSCPDSHFLPH